MKIASIGFTDSGGAGLSSLKLHMALKDVGMNSRFYVINKKSTDKDVLQLRQRGAKVQLSRLPAVDYPHLTYSTGLGGARFDQIAEIDKWADIVLLRWISGILSDHDIAWLTTRRHIFWTLSDMAPITGGCHYTVSNCKEYTMGCEKCPLTKSMPVQSAYPSSVVDRRLKIWKDSRITWISPSNWLGKIARDSIISKESSVVVIPTGVEMDLFMFRLDARQSLGLKPEENVIFFAADSISDPRKGGDLLLPIINTISRHFTQPFKMITAGRSALPNHPLVKHLGQLKEREQMILAYSAADLTLLPYRMDNLPNVMLESLSCGTPVVAFETGGMPEVIQDGINGYLATPFDVNDISLKAIRGLKEMKERRTHIRRSIENKFTMKAQADSYIELFQRSKDD